MPCSYIAVIEDDTDLRETLKDLLEIEGYSVVTAGNGMEGLQALRQNGQPCLILLDLMMPVMDGWEFLEALRQQQDLPSHAPVAVVSAAADIADVQRQYGCSMLKKPVDVERLFALAQEHCCTAR